MILVAKDNFQTHFKIIDAANVVWQPTQIIETIKQFTLFITKAPFSQLCIVIAIKG